MRRLLLGMALVPCFVGCVEMGHNVREAPPSAVTPRSAIAVPVTADRVTPANARRMAEALQNEIDSDDLPPLAATQKAKK